MSIDTFRFIAERNLAHKMLEFFFERLLRSAQRTLGSRMEL